MLTNIITQTAIQWMRAMLDYRVLAGYSVNPMTGSWSGVFCSEWVFESELVDTGQCVFQLISLNPSGGISVFFVL